MTITIQLPIDDEVVALYESAPEEYRQKIGILVSLWLKDWRDSSPDKLLDLMREIGENAQARGLTPDILADILADDSDDE